MSSLSQVNKMIGDVKTTSGGKSYATGKYSSSGAVKYTSGGGYVYSGSGGSSKKQTTKKSTTKTTKPKATGSRVIYDPKTGKVSKKIVTYSDGSVDVIENGETTKYKGEENIQAKDVYIPEKGIEPYPKYTTTTSKEELKKQIKNIELNLTGPLTTKSREKLEKQKEKLKLELIHKTEVPPQKESFFELKAQSMPYTSGLRYLPQKVTDEGEVVLKKVYEYTPQERVQLSTIPKATLQSAQELGKELAKKENVAQKIWGDVKKYSGYNAYTGFTTKLTESTAKKFDELEKDLGKSTTVIDLFREPAKRQTPTIGEKIGFNVLKGATLYTTKHPIGVATLPLGGFAFGTAMKTLANVGRIGRYASSIIGGGMLGAYGGTQFQKAIDTSKGDYVKGFSTVGGETLVDLTAFGIGTGASKTLKLPVKVTTPSGKTTFITPEVLLKEGFEVVQLPTGEYKIQPMPGQRDIFGRLVTEQPVTYTGFKSKIKYVPTETGLKVVGSQSPQSPKVILEKGDTLVQQTGFKDYPLKAKFEGGKIVKFVEVDGKQLKLSDFEQFVNMGDVLYATAPTGERIKFTAKDFRKQIIGEDVFDTAVFVKHKGKWTPVEEFGMWSTVSPKAKQFETSMLKGFEPTLTVDYTKPQKVVKTDIEKTNTKIKTELKENVGKGSTKTITDKPTKGRYELLTETYRAVLEPEIKKVQKIKPKEIIETKLKEKVKANASTKILLVPIQKNLAKSVPKTDVQQRLMTNVQSKYSTKQTDKSLVQELEKLQQLQKLDIDQLLKEDVQQKPKPNTPFPSFEFDDGDVTGGGSFFGGSSPIPPKRPPHRIVKPKGQLYFGTSRQRYSQPVVQEWVVTNPVNNILPRQKSFKERFGKTVNKLIGKGSTNKQVANRLFPNKKFSNWV